jgi:amylosucrase
VYNYSLHQQINKGLQKSGIDIGGKDILFHTRFIANATAIHGLYMELYGHHPKAKQVFEQLLQRISSAYSERTDALKQRDEEKEAKAHWFLSNEITGMSLYVDRFCSSIKNLAGKLDFCT